MKRIARIAAPVIAAVALAAALATSAVAASPNASAPLSGFHFTAAPPVVRA
jgi:hypothetical protein